MVVPRLYRLCVEFLVRFLENVCNSVDWEEISNQERPMKSASSQLQSKSSIRGALIKSILLAPNGPRSRIAWPLSEDMIKTSVLACDGRQRVTLVGWWLHRQIGSSEDANHTGRPKTSRSNVNIKAVGENQGTNSAWWTRIGNGRLLGFHPVPRLVEDMQMFAYSRASRGRTPGEDAEIWRDVWEVFLSPRTECALVCWDRDLLSRLSKYCPNVLRILVCQKNSDSLHLDWIPNSLITLDFDGEIFYRGKRMPIWDHLAATTNKKSRPWLPEAEALFKALYVLRQSPTPPPFPVGVGSRLVEIHLGATRVSTEDLILLLERLPELQLLRHYQMVRALYVKHQDQARKGEVLPKYKLRNLDVDFSHVTRCRMSPEAVLSRDALPLAVRLCPWAEQTRVRCDPATPHDALAPLLELRRLRELCVACVTSGERSLLDFTDILPLLQRHGSNSLVSLQLKVMEEVDTHEILQHCPRLERLLLSGCGNVSSPSCTAAHTCGSPVSLPRLRLLFFADGDDFSWDHALPPCFWLSALGPGEKQSRLEGLFLESPRIPPEILDRLGTWPHLRTLSVCRCPELRLPALLRICKSSPHLRYVRASQCDNIGTKQRQRLQEELPHHVVIVVD